MRNSGRISVLLVLVFLVASCVSKKKYMAMETLKNQYVKQSSSLQNENETLKKELVSAEDEFESLKQNLHFSDAKKDEALADFSRRLKEMEDNFTQAQTELSRTRDLYKDQRFYNTQASNEITRLEFAIEQFKRDTVSLNYSLRLARERNDELQKRLDERVGQINDINTSITELKNEIAGKDASIESIRKELEAQEAKLNEINTAFIELRKEMLRSKTNGTIIDPGTDPNVAKISKALGHF